MTDTILIEKNGELTKDELLLLSLFEHWYVKSNDSRADSINRTYSLHKDITKSHITEVLQEFSGGVMLISEDLVDEAYELVEMVG